MTAFAPLFALLGLAGCIILFIIADALNEIRKELKKIADKEAAQ